MNDPLEEHTKYCEMILKSQSRYMLLEGLYQTFKVTQGWQTDNLRFCILTELAKRDLVPTGINNIHDIPNPYA